MTTKVSGCSLGIRVEIPFITFMKFLQKKYAGPVLQVTIRSGLNNIIIKTNDIDNNDILTSINVWHLM